MIGRGRRENPTPHTSAMFPMHEDEDEELVRERVRVRVQARARAYLLLAVRVHLCAVLDEPLLGQIALVGEQHHRDLCGQTETETGIQTGDGDTAPESTHQISIR